MIEATWVQIWNSHWLVSYTETVQNIEKEFTDLTANGRIHWTSCRVMCVVIILFLFLFWGMAVISSDFATGITHCRASCVQNCKYISFSSALGTS